VEIWMLEYGEHGDPYAARRAFRTEAAAQAAAEEHRSAVHYVDWSKDPHVELWEDLDNREFCLIVKVEVEGE
jgi:hypothetical protein